MKELIILTFLSSYALSFLPKGIENIRLPGTVEIVDNFYFDAAEVSNRDWRDYLSSLKEEYGEHSAEYINAQPDQTVWTKEDVGLQPFVDTYFYHPSYDWYPVVGITHEQVVTYCQWRTDTVKKMLDNIGSVSYTHLRAHETDSYLVCRLLLEKKK